jgi:hypothetical protein
MKRHLILASGALVLASCDAAAPAVQAQVRHSFIQQCQQLAEGNGLAPGLVQPICECGAEEFVKGGVNVSDISAARVQEIVNTCTQRSGQPGGAPATENTGG